MKDLPDDLAKPRPDHAGLWPGVITGIILLALNLALLFFALTT